MNSAVSVTKPWAAVPIVEDRPVRVGWSPAAFRYWRITSTSCGRGATGLTLPALGGDEAQPSFQVLHRVFVGPFIWLSGIVPRNSCPHGHAPVLLGASAVFAWDAGQ